jgi:uncharacterized protein
MTDDRSGPPGDMQARQLCATCHLRPQTEKYRPFCSKRCADIDLHRWLGGVYAIPGKAEEEEDGMPGASPPPESSGE